MVLCLSNTPRSHTSLQCTGQPCLPPVPLPNLPTMHLEIQNARNKARLSHVPQNTDFTVWGREEM